MKSGTRHKAESLASRIEAGLLQYEMILLSVAAVGLVFYYLGRIWAGTVILAAGLILGMVYFFRWFLPSGDQKVLETHRKTMSLGLAFAVMGSAFRVLYMQSDVLFLVTALVSLVVSLVILWVKQQEPCFLISRPSDRIRLILWIIISALLIFWQPPLPEVFDPGIFTEGL